MTSVNKKFHSFIKSSSTAQIPNVLNEFHPPELALPPGESCPNSNLTNFLVTYFDFSFFLCFSPFRFVSQRNNGWFTLRTRMPQKAICVLLHSTAIFIWLAEFRIRFQNMDTHNLSPLHYFTFLYAVISFVLQVTTIKQFWTDSQSFLNILNFIQRESDTLPKGNLRILRKTFSRFICVTFAGMAMSDFIWTQLLAQRSTWNETIWNRALVKRARVLFSMTNETSSRKVPLPKSEDLSGLDYFATFIVAVGYLEKNFLGFYVDLCLVFMVLTVWTATYLFARNLDLGIAGNNTPSSGKMDNSIFFTSPGTGTHSEKKMISQKSQSQSQWPEIYQTYQSIRGLCHSINHVCGTLVTLYIADSLLYHSTGMDSILVTKDVTNKVRLLFFICNSTCAFILSADVCKQLDSLKLWLTRDENRRDIPMDQQSIIMNELQSNMVGIRGSNIFTITYPLLWHMMTTVVTYFIICMQTRQQEQLRQSRN